MTRFPEEHRWYPEVNPVEAVGVLAANVMIYLDRAMDHIVKWRPRLYTRLLARAIAHRARITTRVDDWQRGA
jgi:hypothetical protein